MTDASRAAEPWWEGPPPNSELWHGMFGDGLPALRKLQRFYARVPSSPRCKMCNRPFGGIGGWMLRLRGTGPSTRNRQFCNLCDRFIVANPGGAEVTLSLLYVDGVDSTELSSSLPLHAWLNVLNRFYDTVRESIEKTDGFIMDVSGDGVVAVYPPGFTGRDHARHAIEGAVRMLERSARNRESEQPQLRLRVAVHTGPVLIGTLGQTPEGPLGVRVFGPGVHLGARLSKLDREDCALITSTAYDSAGADFGGERVRMHVDGFPAEIDIRILRVNPAVPAAARG